jgi:hypothetical protein
VWNFYLNKSLASLNIIYKFSLNRFLTIYAIILEFIWLWSALVVLPKQKCSSGFILISQVSVMLGVPYNVHGYLEYLHVITNFNLLLFVNFNFIFRWTRKSAIFYFNSYFILICWPTLNYSSILSGLRK